MKMQLRTMTAAEYNDFFEYSRKHHADELMRELRMSPEEAMAETEKELQEMLTDGRNTKDHYFMVIENAADGRNVGSVWFLSEQTDGVRQVFLCDFVIWEQERRKGCATAALQETETYAKSNGWQECVLFVANDNTAARHLYAKCGYRFLKNGDYGMFLMKKLLEPV